MEKAQIIELEIKTLVIRQIGLGVMLILMILLSSQPCFSADCGPSSLALCCSSAEYFFRFCLLNNLLIKLYIKLIITFYQRVFVYFYPSIYVRLHWYQ